MSKAKQLHVKEQVTELKRLLANRSITISNRIRMLILIIKSIILPSSLFVLTSIFFLTLFGMKYKSLWYYFAKVSPYPNNRNTLVVKS